MFVATLMVAQNKATEAITSLATWGANGLNTLLPEVETIAFVELDENENAKASRTATWDRVQAVMDDVMHPVGLYPERWRVNTFPTPEQLEAMGAVEGM